MRTIYLVSVWLHIVAAMTWLGGILMFLITVLPWISRLDAGRRAGFQAAFGRRLAVVTWTAIAVLALTGAFSLWVRGVRPGDFLRPDWRATSFGHIVLTKLTLVLLVVAACLGHQFLRAPGPAKWLGRLALVLGLATVAAAVALVRDIGVTPVKVRVDASVPGAWFVNTGCTSCHSVSVYGHHNLAATGPDLSLAVEDVPRRFGRSLDDFLRTPTGTMQLVLGGRIHLTPAERDDAIRQLKEAYEKYRRAHGLGPMSGH